MIQKLSVLVLALSSASLVAQVPNPDVTQDNIRQTICTSGWTKSIRPPVTYTGPIKDRLVAAAGGNSEDYELDHIIPLAVGGHPTDPRNLQLQLWDGPDGAKAKDVVELRVKRLVCTGHITLAQGQQCFIDGWKTCPRH